MSTHNLCFEQKYKKISEFFYLKIFSLFFFFLVKVSVYLNRHVLVMDQQDIYQNKLQSEKTYLQECASNKDSNQPAHMCSLI